jgi:hypothetical protein
MKKTLNKRRITIQNKKQKTNEPLYYKYIGTKGNGFTFGKIYKINKPKNIEAFFNFKNDNGVNSGFAGENHKNFKPSTLKAFTQQESLNKKTSMKTTKKTLVNTDTNGAKKNVKDIQFWGDGDTFKLISKASSISEGWMKSTKAMQIDTVGCVVQVTTQQGNNIAEAVTFVPNVKIKETKDKEGKVISRKLVAIYNI